MPADRARRLRILHVTSGFRPWLINGLVTYAEDLMAAQLERGHRVECFFPGRHYPLLRRPRMHRWRRRGVRMHELLNSPIVIGGHAGTLDPDADLWHSLTERAFAEVLTAARPDVVHIHDLGGLPSSLIDVARARGVAVVMTLHDYHALCPVVKLYDVDRNVCLRERPGHQCARCSVGAPRDNAGIAARTLAFEGIRARKALPALGLLLDRPRVWKALTAIGHRIAQTAAPGASADPAAAPAATAAPAAYDRRREVNVERLNSCDRLMPVSYRGAEIYARLGVDPARMRPMHLGLGHVENLRPARIAGTSSSLTFAALNVMVSEQKGRDLVLATLRILEAQGLAGRFRLLVAGYVTPEAERELRRRNYVVLAGPYEAPDLPHILGGVDVGIVPSLWEELYGLVGPEFLAMGIPVIGNAMGGIPEYTRDGKTGWLNRSNSAAGLAEIMASLISDPGQVERLSRRVIERRDELVKPIDAHVGEVQAIYAEALAAVATNGDRAPRTGASLAG